MPAYTGGQQTRAGGDAPEEPGKGAERSAMRARISEWRAVPGAQSERQAAVPDARGHGRSESGEAGPGPHGGRRQHSGGNQEIASSNYRWEAGLKADWASGIHDPASGMERNEDDNSAGGSKMNGGIPEDQFDQLKCYILGLLMRERGHSGRIRYRPSKI